MRIYFFLMVILAIVICSGCSEQPQTERGQIENPCILEVGNTVNITIFEEGNVTLIIGENGRGTRYSTELEGCYKDITMVVTRGEVPRHVNVGDVYKIRVTRDRGNRYYEIEIVEVLLDN